MSPTLTTLDRPLAAPADIGASATASVRKSAASSVFLVNVCDGAGGEDESAAGLKGRGQISEAAILQLLQVNRSLLPDSVRKSRF